MTQVTVTESPNVANVFTVTLDGVPTYRVTLGRNGLVSSVRRAKRGDKRWSYTNWQTLPEGGKAFVRAIHLWETGDWSAVAR